MIDEIIEEAQSRPKRKRIKRNLLHPYFGSVGYHRSLKRHGTKHAKSLKIYRVRFELPVNDADDSDDILHYPLADNAKSYIVEDRIVIQKGFKRPTINLGL